jgi:hypothetical protein
MKVSQALIAAVVALASGGFIRAASLGYDFDHSGAATASYINALDYSTSLSEITNNFWGAYTYGGDVSSFTAVSTFADANSNPSHYGLGSLSVDKGSYLALTLTNDSSYSYANFKYYIESTCSDPLAFEYALVSNASLAASSFTPTTLSWLNSTSSITLDSGYSVLFRWASAGSSSYTIDKVFITATQIPEPSTYALLLGVGTLGLVGWRRFRRK